MARFAIHEQVCNSKIRLYLDAESGQEAFDKRKAYDVHVDIKYETPEIVFVESLSSRVKLCREDFEDLKAYGRAKGIKKIRFERGGEIIEEEL
jgi:hypothetical protein